MQWVLDASVRSLKRRLMGKVNRLAQAIQLFFLLACVLKLRMQKMLGLKIYLLLNVMLLPVTWWSSTICSILRTSVCQRTRTFHQHQLHQGEAEPGWLEQRRLSDHILHPGVPSRGLGHLDHGSAHLAHQELHPVRPAGGDVVWAADEGHQQRRLGRKADHLRHTQCWWKWVGNKDTCKIQDFF